MKLTFLNKVLNKEKVIEDLPKLAKKVYPKEVEEIHNEFDTACDKLLVQANDIIKEAESKDISKINRLESLGFTNVKQVTEIKPILEKSELSKEQVKLIQDYKVRYPNNKFITEEQVKQICHKYNLVCGPVNRFKGFVPENNLRDVEKFKLRKEDELPNIVVFIGNTRKIEPLDWNKIIDVKKVQWYIDVYLPKNGYTYIKSKGVTTNSESTYPNYTQLINRSSYNDREFKIQEQLQIGLQICAPVKDMDITNLTLKDGYKLERHVPDPVVLQPVKGGYLIITAWGDEASDPLVVNETNN